MTTFTKKVLSLNWEEKGKRKWRSISEMEVKGGQVFKSHLFPGEADDLIAYFSEQGPGIYELDKEKGEDGYWKILDARKVGELPAGTNTSQAKSGGAKAAAAAKGNGSSSAQSAAAAAAPKASGAELKTRIATEAMKAAAYIVAAALGKGAIKTEEVTTLLTSTVDELREDAIGWIKGEQKPPQQQQGTAGTEEGA